MNDARLTLDRRPRALFLDAGDTLIFLSAPAVAEVLAAQGQQVAAEAIQRALHPAKRRYQQHLVDGSSHEDGWSVLVRALLTESGVAPGRADALLPSLREAHMDFNFWRRVPDELPAALERARDAGIRLGIISNSEGKLESVLVRVGIREHFEHVIDSALVGTQKPEPAIFHLALEQFGVAPSEAVYAGDIPEVDVHGAHGVGMHGALIDAFDAFAERDDVTRFVSVAALVDHLLTLPALR